MTDVIHNYPKSSCACWERTKDNFPKPTGVPTNMSVRGCNFSEHYDPTLPFKSQTEPQNKSGKIILNPYVIAQNKFDPTFQSINANDCPQSACSGTTYINSDPRLYNSASVSWIQLDRPPLNSTPKLNTLNSDKTLDCYGQKYTSYADIDGGQCVYYISKDREDAFYEPLFSKEALITGTMYKDPMGAMKPHYTRVPKDKHDPILGDPCDVAGDYCLSWMKDTQNHREDLLARQMSRRNQERYETRWTNNKFN